jgi:cell wall assembly regulator SMI1
MKPSRIMAIRIIFSLVLVAGLAFMAKTRIRKFFYPTAPTMPAIVERPISEILARLEATITAKAPHVLESLQPGLTAEQIVKLERESGVQLPDDIKAFYQWRNGSTRPTNGMSNDFIPTHRFLSLEEALEERTLIKSQVKSATLVQNAAVKVFAGHRGSWISLFNDGAGDGYFFDPNRKPSEGAVFYCFAETTSYTFFPSVKNLLAAITKCYEQEVFHIKSGSNSQELETNFEQAEMILGEFGSANNE